MDEGLLTFTHQTWLNNNQHLFMRVRASKTKTVTNSSPLMHYHCWIRGQRIPYVFPNCIWKEGCSKGLQSLWSTLGDSYKTLKKRHSRETVPAERRLHAACSMLNIAGINYVHAPKNKVLYRNAIPRNIAVEKPEFCPRSTAVHLPQQGSNVF